MEDAPRTGRKQSNFSLGPPSASSSRSSSLARSDESDPVPNGNGVPYGYGLNGPGPLSKEAAAFLDDVTPGRKPMDVYDATLPWWRAAIRRWLVERVRVESEILARMQERIRHPFLDAYFVYTSNLGTHTFFMILLPALYFFGYNEIGTGLIVVLALGVYFSSVIKDLICSPRPFAPPVTRLTIGSHHLEYGFPSTHSTNSVSIALFFFSLIHGQTFGTSPTISPELFLLLSTLLAIYSVSIVFGRLYTAMHSFTDCAMGVTLGTLLWWVLTSWSGIPVVFSSTNPLYYLLSILPVGEMTASGLVVHIGQGLGLTARIHSWVQTSGWPVPAILIPLCLLLVNQHPQPVDDCPCFEDAIAFLSVVLGILLGRWAVGTSGSGHTIVMPGSGWILSSGEWTQIERGWEDVLVWWSVAALKMVVGILTIFVWRIVAKSTLHLVLPPIFRLLAKIFDLPNRRFYTPATDYKSVPSEFNTPNGFGLHPIPSVIDLPGSAGVGVEVGGIGSGVDGVELLGGEGRDVKMRSVGGGEKEREKKVDFDVLTSRNEAREDKNGRPVKHYDADVLTKVAVYAGIGLISAEIMPFMFEYIGWGTKSWV